nr:AAA family ATPase [Knoellia sp. DB2414S]
MKVQRAAKAALEAELVPEAPPFDHGTLRQILERPKPPPMRAPGLVPSEAGVLVVAQRKTGKTTLELNWARCLLTGETFLGRFPVRPIKGKVAILNYEVSGDTLGLWADERGVPADRLHLVNLRGRRNPLSHPGDRERLADILRGEQVEAIIVDPFGRAFTGKSQNDPGEVGAWLVDLDLFARGEVGATDLMLTAHAGWNGERSRGSSALEDWADSILWMTRDQNDDTKRFLRAEGRDVLVDEDQLLFDESTRTLAMAGTGGRKKARTAEKVHELMPYVRRAAAQVPGGSRADLTRAMRKMPDCPSFQDRDVAAAADLADEQGHMRIEDMGPGKAKRHYPATPSNPVQTPSTDAPPTPRPTPSIGGRGRGGRGQGQEHALDVDGVSDPSSDSQEAS